MITWFSPKKSDLRKTIDDYLAPLPAHAPIRGLISSPEVEQHLREFDRADRAAIKRQASYRRASRLALWAGFVGAIVAALGLLPIAQVLPQDALHTTKVLSVILTSLAIMWLSFRQSGARWLRERGVAEERRGQVFHAIVGAGCANTALLPHALDFFNKAHFARQLAFFEKRSADYDEVARKNRRYRLVGRFLWAVSALLAIAAIAHLAASYRFENPILATVSHWMRMLDLDRWHLGIDAMAASILAFASERSSMDRDTRTAQSYAEAAKDLSEIEQADLQNAVGAAAQGNHGPVTDFCNRVQTVLDAEHRAWRYMR